ncbi:hypothetical protein DEJ50_01450 [Streptomyces venezuelae]|uniref:Uncharacterized protein n=1 Tax=Streptomyces venezuelae TaxID=54571 RepID=A0A5P2CY70_STRVZ|nr:hypothetical protein [Streptomyces venezuelae]QES46718.1 hypothetical protein DEJ50_01450 [Streptomyces venezuelae]
MHPPATERDEFEARLQSLFGDKLRPVEESFETISRFKDGSFAMGHLGLMLYTNGYNVRGTSTHHPNGLVFHDGENLFGVGYFSKEDGPAKHLHIVAPKGPDRIAAVTSFVAAVREAGLARTTVYVRHLSPSDHALFLAAGFEPVSKDPWHPVAPEEDETHPNRVYHLEEILEPEAGGGLRVRNLPGEANRKYKSKNRLAHRRFENFLARNDHLGFHVLPYGHSTAETAKARGIVEGYFAARREQGEVVGSTPEDYRALITQRPGGLNEHDYFAYLGSLTVTGGEEVPVMFFAGERTADHRASLYCTMSMRFPERLTGIFKDPTGFTAIPQYVWLTVFKKMWNQGIREVDAGGSEVKGLDDQKRQLGGRPEKTHWVVC